MNKSNALRLTAVAMALAAAGCASTMDGTSAGPTVQMAATPAPAAVDSEFPPNARPGECYARVYVPRVYRTVQETMLKRDAADKVDIIAAKYEEVEERVLVKPASTRIEVVPAVFETVEERLMSRAASTRIEEVPATYESVSEQVMVTPGYTTWQFGQGSPGQLTKIDDATGDVMCLVEVPPVYKTVTKEILKAPATTRVVEVPAEYTTVKKEVMKTPPTTREVEVPAEYTTVKVAKLVSPPQEMKTAVPAEYQTVERQVLVSEARQEFRQILCKTNSTPQKISQIQGALKANGYNPGRTDGAVTEQTFTALNQYQKAKGLPVDEGHYFNMATVTSLGVSPD